jgi:iron complex outermembrane recepter protein
MIGKTSFCALCVGLLATPGAAFAQRTDDNATTQSEDAFGTSVGGEAVGIYSPFNVRGFSPQEAGNIRIEGLYFDQQGNLTDRLVAGNTVRVGISAQGYPFPAPTGIGDYSLRKAGKETIASVGLNWGPWGGKSAEVDLELPLDGERLGIAAGAGLYRETNIFHGTPHFFSSAVSLRYAPSPGVEIIPFWSRIEVDEDESQPLIFTTGDFLPPRVRRDRFLGQKWAEYAGTVQNYGLIAKARVAGVDAALGVFRSQNDGNEDHVDLLFDTDRNGVVGNRVVIALGANRFASTSGELRLSRTFADGPRNHKLIASVKARSQDRRYGGEDFLSLGPSVIGVQDFRPEPTKTFGPKTLDKVEQTTLGIGYQGIWRGVGELSLGLQKSDYTKSITNPAPVLSPPDSVSKPWLFSANAALYASPSVAFYAGYTRGLEESPVAPQNAVNRSVAPPAIRTEQKEIGVRWRVSPGVSLVVGGFDIVKPYFNLDAASLFRELGEIRHRGFEISLAGPVAKGLYLVGGMVWLDGTVSGEEVDRGLIGRRPIGTFRRHNIMSVNYDVAAIEGFSLNAFFEATSDRTANAANTLVIPARSVTSVGARYRFKIGDATVLARFNVGNIFNKFGWAVGGSGFFIPNGNRRYSFSLAADL